MNCLKIKFDRNDNLTTDTTIEDVDLLVCQCTLVYIAGPRLEVGRHCLSEKIKWY